MNHLRLGRHHHRIHALTFLLLMASVFGVINSGYATKSGYADTGSPLLGVVNFCKLRGSQTIVYGWAADSTTRDSPAVRVSVGGVTKTIDTSVNGYHDTEINRYVRSHGVVGGAKPSTDGFAVTFDNLYKGGEYDVSAAVLGTDGRQDVQLPVSTTSKNYDGISGGSMFTANRTLPDACLLAKPDGARTRTVTSRLSSTIARASAAVSGPKVAADTTADDQTSAAVSDQSVAAGTLSATVNAAANGAASAYVQFGPALDNLQTSTSSQSVTGDPTRIIVPNLLAKTKYYYQIIRTMPDGSTVPDAVGDFTTAGYTINLKFVNAQKKPVSGVTGLLNEASKATVQSDDKGLMSFYDLGPGTYSVTYEQAGTLYVVKFNTSDAPDDATTDGQTVLFTSTVNVSNLKGGVAGSLGGSTPIVTILLIVGIPLLIIIGVWLLVRRFKKRAEVKATYEHPGHDSLDPSLLDVPTAQAAQYVPPMPTTPTGPSGQPLVNPLFNAPFVPPTRPVITPADQTVTHAGQSLRDMVIESMHEQAMRQNQTASAAVSPPPTPPNTQPPTNV